MKKSLLGHCFCRACSVNVRSMRLISLILISSQLGACGLYQGITVHEDVQPWQRGILAQENMQIPHDKVLKEFDDHIYFSKEASTGGFGVGGGGCGCN